MLFHTKRLPSSRNFARLLQSCSRKVAANFVSASSPFACLRVTFPRLGVRIPAVLILVEVCSHPSRVCVRCWSLFVSLEIVNPKVRQPILAPEGNRGVVDTNEENSASVGVASSVLLMML